MRWLQRNKATDAALAAAALRGGWGAYEGRNEGRHLGYVAFFYAAAVVHMLAPERRRRRATRQLWRWRRIAQAPRGQMRVWPNAVVVRLSRGM